MIEFFSYSLSLSDLVALVAVAILIGMAKTGVSGAGMIAVPIMAIAFGGKASTGILLTILIFADLFAVWHYHRHANWSHLKRLLPFALVGVVIGTVIGGEIDEATFRLTMAVIIFISLGIMLWQERNPNPKISTSFWFIASIGILGGITTMVGNLAGPVMALYLLAMRFPKQQFIGTAAWFFLLINLLKIPFHVFAWQTISVDSTVLTASLIPAIAVGAYLGIWITNKINESAYRWLVILTTALAAVAMIF